jgi:hypothetical protein
MWVRFHTKELEYTERVSAFLATFPRISCAVALVAALAALGCSSDESSEPGASGGSSGADAGGGSAQAVPVVTRVARLTHAQYDSTVAALLGVSDKLAGSFAPDAAEGYAFDNGIDLRVDGRLGPQYRAAAEELAEKVAADATFVGRIAGCEESAADCGSRFVAELGKRAFRRPLSSVEQTRFLTLFGRGVELVGSGNAFRDGVRLVVEALLQSPQFLYRTELSATAGEGGLIPLDSWEMATRLSYFLWGSMPDVSLFEAAAQGKLVSPSDVSAAAQRLLEDPRARAAIVSFHAQALRFARFQKVAPDASKYPSAPAGMPLKLREAEELFVEDVVFTSHGGIAELLSAPYAYADAGLAPIYGKAVAGAGFQKLTFAPGERAGYLMQAGFLASNAYAIRTDPIHRGLFVQRDLLCRTIPDPPPGASMTPLPPTSDTIKTTRQQIELLTSPASCSACHQLINAPGFAFEAYDAIGQLRSSDNGAAIDTSGTTMLDQQPVSFANAAELAQALSQSAEARACYVGKWLEYAYGRSQTDGDAAARAALARSPLATLELVAQLTTSAGFRFRAPNPVE